MVYDEDKLWDGQDDSGLISQKVDAFLEKPTAEPEYKKVQQAIDERNVCVVLSYVDNDPNLVMSLLTKLNKLCAANQEVTDTHRVALFVLIKDSNQLNRLGFCDELTASNIVYRLCACSKIATEVYREFSTPLQRKITEEDLHKRPFRF